MAKFRKKKLGGSDQINTSALPDIIFMLLFFFMVTTVLREQVFSASEAAKQDFDFLHFHRKAKKHESLRY